MTEAKIVFGGVCSKHLNVSKIFQVQIAETQEKMMHKLNQISLL